MLSYQPVIPAPFMTYEEYSRYTGFSIRHLRTLQKEGRLIIKQKANPKEVPQVNVIAMTEIAAREAIAALG
ncbi:hypothetical protein [Vibrio rumoiensis]|uniref:hypothetical protein n=1 Tax=Vibrio rumoiensis TaxID=76258 RepID=UPI003AA7D836